MRRKTDIVFPSNITQANNCLCSACHALGRVIKLAMPTTLYFDTEKLTTNYHPYWLCKECRDKLVRALDWEE